MKKALYCLLLCLVLQSCKKDDAFTILGTWNATEVEFGELKEPASEFFDHFSLSFHDDNVVSLKIDSDPEAEATYSQVNDSTFKIDGEQVDGSELLIKVSGERIYMDLVGEAPSALGLKFKKNVDEYLTVRVYFEK